MKRVLLLFVLFSFCLAAPPLAMQLGLMPDIRIRNFWPLFFFYAVLTLLILVFVLLVRGRKDAKTSAQAFLAATVIKLLLCMGIALACILKTGPDKAHFVINFFYLYFSNTAFEVYALIRNLRH